MVHRIVGIFAILLILTIPAISAFGQTPTVSKVPVIILFKEKPIDKHVNLIKSVGGEVTRTYKIINGFAANLPETSIENLKHNPLVTSIDPDLEVKAIDTSADIQIRADQVWAAGVTGTGVPVAILDTGIDTTHPEFSGRILKCHSEITNTNTCTDGNGHGTHVAGIAAAAGINTSAKGVAPSASLYIDQVLNSKGSGTISGVIAGIDWARTNGAKVISMSLGTSPISTVEPNCDSVLPSLTTAINNAVASGISVVAAAGNDDINGVGAPACISSTIAVAAVDSADNIASFSSRGGPVADHGIAAPGVNIFSSWKNGGYNTISGTSMATPLVSGTIALLLKANPTLSPATIKSTLFSTTCTSSTTPSCPTGSVPNTAYGYGRIDALATFNAVAVPVTVPTAPSAPVLSTTGNTATSIGISWTTPANGGSAITGYTYQWSTDNFASITGSTPVSAGTNSATISGLSASTSYNIRVFATNAIGNSASSNVLTVATSATPQVATSVSVTNISYFTEGGKNADKHLDVKLTLRDNLLNPVQSASVSINLFRNSILVASGTGTTLSDGTITFVLRNASPGTYSTVVTTVSAGSLTWDKVTPSNSYTKIT